jgi:hypothetical protein
VIEIDNPVDGILKLVRERVTLDDISLSFDDETLKQYLAYHIIHGNAIWTQDDETQEVTGILIAYECDRDEAGAPFNWVEPNGKNCIYVAQLAARDEDARDTLAQGYLALFPDEKPTYATRRGSLVPMNAHKISRELLRKRGSNGGR